MSNFARMKPTWKSVAVVTLLGAAAVLSWAERSFGVACGAGQTCSCTPAPADSCVGGFPDACDPCRGLFQFCYDKYCDFASYRCDQNSDGVTNCQETLIALVSGMHRECVSGELDWANCWGQPYCRTWAVNNVAGNRYSCDDSGS